MSQQSMDPVLLEKKVVKMLADLKERKVKINYNHVIDDLKEWRYRDRASAKLGNKIFGDMYSVLVFAGGSYVNGKIKKSVSKLSDCIASLTVAGKEIQDLEQIENESEKIISKLKIAEGKKGMIKEETLKAVQSVIDAADALATYYPEKSNLIANLMASKEAAQQLKTTLEGCLDNSSKAAEKNSQDIMKWIYKWRGDVSLLICDSEDVGGLKEACNIAEQWNALSIPRSRRDTVKDSEVEKFNPQGTQKHDVVTKILRGQSSFEKLESLKDAVADYNKATEKRYDVTATQNQITQNQNKIEALQSRKKQLVVAVQNGDLSRESVYAELKKIDNEVNKLKVETYGGTVQRPDGRVVTTEGLQGKISEAQSYVDERNEFIETLNEPILKLETYKDDIGNFVTLMSKVDVKNLIGLLRGRMVDKETLVAAVESLNNVIIQEIEDMKTRGEMIKTSEQMHDYVSEVLRERTPSLDAISNKSKRRETVYVPTENQKQTAGGADSEMDAYFAELFGEQAEEKEQQKNQNSNVSRLINLDDDK